MQNFKQASEVILSKIKEVEEKSLLLNQKELDLIQRDGELADKASVIDAKIKKYTIDPEVVESERVRNQQENKRLVELSQSISIREGNVREKEEIIKNDREDIEARFKDIEIRENDIRNKSIKLIEKEKTIKEDVEKEVFDRIMQK